MSLHFLPLAACIILDMTGSPASWKQVLFCNNPIAMSYPSHGLSTPAAVRRLLIHQHKKPKKLCK